jgi:putative aldouronate transport system permease protein
MMKIGGRVMNRKQQALLGARGIWQLHLFMLLPLVFVILWCYVPMGGILIAFKDYSVRRGIWGSQWAGFKYFDQFFSVPAFGMVLRNTIILSLEAFIIGFPFPILLALGFNDISNFRVKKILQTITYAPYFISTVVVVSIVVQLFHYRYGVFNMFFHALGMESYDFMSQDWFFRPAYIWSGVWQGAGYSSILYLAALSAIDVSLYDAAIIDGASKLQRVRHIDIPGIMPTIIITLILSMGGLLGASTEKVLLLQNPLNYRISEVIGTYVYKVGISQAQFSFATAVGLFNSLVNFVLLFLVNSIIRRINETSLF